MTDEQKSLIGRLARCRMLPGDWDKMFIKSLCALPTDHELSEPQIMALERLHYKYRKQLGEPDLAKPPHMQPFARSLRAAERQHQQLEDWRAGRAKR